MNDRFQVWSSGGGTQSAAIAALIVRGDIPHPDLAVIVDTEREVSSTWEYHDAVIVPALKRVGVTLHRIPKSQFATCHADSEPQCKEFDRQNPLNTLNRFDGSLRAGSWATVAYIVTPNYQEKIAIPVVK